MRKNSTSKSVGDIFESKSDSQGVVYCIRTEGHLDCQWADWFNGLSIVKEETGTTLLTGPVRDQAELYAILKKVRDIGMTLLSVNTIESDQFDTASSGPSKTSNKSNHESFEKGEINEH